MPRTDWTIPHMRNCPSKCALVLDACVHINIACAYTSVQFYEHHLYKLQRHITCILIIFYCTLHYICSFVLCTLLIGGNKELLLLLLIRISYTCILYRFTNMISGRK